MGEGVVGGYCHCLAAAIHEQLAVAGGIDKTFRAWYCDAGRRDTRAFIAAELSVAVDKCQSVFCDGGKTRRGYNPLGDSGGGGATSGGVKRQQADAVGAEKTHWRSADNPRRAVAQRGHHAVHSCIVGASAFRPLQWVAGAVEQCGWLGDGAGGGRRN